jgi:hypothetical protein
VTRSPSIKDLDQRQPHFMPLAPERMRRIVDRNAALSADGLFDDE